MAAESEHAADSATTISDLAVKDVPGSYGVPFFSPIKDRLEFYYGGQDKFFQSRVDKYKSTVVRLNMPPGPFMASDPRVIAVLDAESFTVLFDVSKVEKKNVFTGTYMPSTSITGGYRVCAYLDPSEPNHTKIKQLLFNLLASRKDAVIPAFRTNFSALFDTVEKQIASSARKSDFNKLNDNTSLEFLGEAYYGVRPSSTDLGTKGPTKSLIWLVPQLAPLLSLGLPKILEEIFLHTFPIPPIVTKPAYKSLYKYFSSVAGSALDNAEKLGLSREEATHNLLFATIFNSYGGFKVLLPSIMSWLAQADKSLHARLVAEIRSAVASEGGKVTLNAVEKMELTRSVVYEAMRMDPPVKYQYGHAKTDLVIESHDAAYRVKKGEMIFGYQPFATRDARVFDRADQYVGDRFVGNEGKKLIKYVYWSNGLETVNPTVADKQCAGKEFVVLVARLLVVEFFLRYDTFEADVSTVLLGAQVNITSVTKATSSSHTASSSI